MIRPKRDRRDRAGEMVVLVDDEDRENEGDLTLAADKVTPEAINFMAVHGRGLICLSLTAERVGASASADGGGKHGAVRNGVHGGHRRAGRRDDGHLGR